MKTAPIIALIALLLASPVLSDFGYVLNLTSLPLTITENVSYPVDLPVAVTYSGHLQGPQSAIPQAGFVVNLTLPVTPPGNYQSILKDSLNNTVVFTYSIINDLTESDFTLSTDKPGYYVNESVLITINAPGNTTLKLNITGANQSEFYETTVDEGAALMFIPKNDATYTITATMESFGQVYVKSRAVNVTKKLKCEIIAPSSGYVNQSITFTPRLEGAVGSTYHAWTIGTENNSTSILRRSFLAPGDYLIRLVVKDSRNEQTACSAAIEIREAVYTVEVIVLAGSLAVGDAKVELDGQVKKTSSLGKARFYGVNAGRYDLKIGRNGFSDLKEKITIEKDTTISMNLSQKKVQGLLPEIQIKGPANNSELSELKVEFSLTKGYPANCSLQIKEGSQLGFVVASRLDVAGSSDHTLVGSLGSHDYTAKVVCENSHGIGESSRLSIAGNGMDPEPRIIKESPIVPIQDEESTLTANITTAIEKMLADYKTTTPEKKAIYELFGYPATLQKNKEMLVSLGRQLSDLETLQLGGDSYKTKKAELLREVRAIESTSPVALNILKKESIISQVSLEETKDAISEYIKARELDNADIDEMASSSREMQDDVIISVDLRHVEIEFYSGAKKQVSIVQKRYDLPENMTGFILEVIPKTVADDARKIEFSSNYEIVRQDPIVKFDVMQSISYHIQGLVQMEELKKTKSVFMAKQAPGADSITGFSTFTGRFNNASLIGALAVCGVAAGLIAFRSKVRIPVARPQKNQCALLINQALDHIKEERPIDAVKLYPCIMEEYAGLGENAKEHILPMMQYLSHLADYHYVADLLEKANEGLINGSVGIGGDLVKEIESTYPALPKNYAQILDKKHTEYRALLNMRLSRQGAKMKSMAGYGESIENSLYAAK